MRYRLAVLMLLLLLAMLPLMDVLAAPAPEPYAILDIGPPPKDKTAEQHLKFQIERTTSLDVLNDVCSDPEVSKLPSVAPMTDARPWLAKNLRVTPEDGERRLRFAFRAGKRNEQVAILNAFLRARLFWHDMYGGTVKWTEECIRTFEKDILDVEQLIESGKLPHPFTVDYCRKEINYVRYTRIPELRAEVTGLKQYAVIKWAR